MMSIFLTALVLPVILLGVQWIVSDLDSLTSRNTCLKSKRETNTSNSIWRAILMRKVPTLLYKKSHEKRKLEVLIEILLGASTVFIFLLTLHNFISGRVQAIFSELFILVVSLSTSIFFRYTQKKKKLDNSISEIDLEIPSVIVMFSLLVSAGESLRGAIEYLSNFPQSRLSRVFSAVSADNKNGLSLTQALDKSAVESQSRSFRKFTDALALSIDRGSPLSVVLAHQTTEARSAFKAELLRIAGKAEIKLMIPIVFLILPISVVFALLPSLRALSTVM